MLNKKKSSRPSKKKASAKSPTSNASRNAPAADARASTDRVEKSFVGDGSIDTYVGQLARFGTYLFDNHTGKLSDGHLEKMTDAHNEDK
eukprot:scaffold3554_cov199-Skeletonema_menzelii.AAC.1